jgi:hypothetical protein
LATVLVVALAAVLAGAKTLAGIAGWAADQPGWALRRVGAVVESLLAAARGAYRQIGCRFIPLVVDRATAAAVHEIGATPIREYSQSIWLKPAFEAWYDHVDGLYAERLGPRRQS